MKYLKFSITIFFLVSLQTQSATCVPFASTGFISKDKDYKFNIDSWEHKDFEKIPFFLAIDEENQTISYLNQTYNCELEIDALSSKNFHCRNSSGTSAFILNLSNFNYMRYVDLFSSSSNFDTSVVQIEIGNCKN
tara:strand:+ start:546 stop:950 length:405 start_codon:yes stop_codon:yes gene_type:complete